MTDIANTLLSNPFVQGVLVAGAGWLGNKVAKLFSSKKAGKVAAALATSSSLMLQYILTANPHLGAGDIITACKGIVAIQFAKVGIFETERAKYQPMIDVAISAAVTEWVKRHPAPKSVTLPHGTTP